MNKRIEIIRILNNMLIMFMVSAVVSLGFGALTGKTLVLSCMVLTAFVLLSEIIPCIFPCET